MVAWVVSGKSNLSYAAVLHGGKGGERRSSPVSVVIPENVVVREKSWLKYSLIGEIIDLERLSKCLSMVHAYGLGECDIKYLGGLSVMHGMNLFRHEVGRFGCESKGVPVSLWDSKIFSRIASVFGKVLIPFECNVEAENLSYGKVCVLRESLEFISNQEVEVLFKKCRFKVLVGEDGDWQPGLNEEEEEYTDSDINDEEERVVLNEEEVIGKEEARAQDGMGDDAGEGDGECRDGGGGDEPWISSQSNDEGIGMEDISYPQVGAVKGRVYLERTASYVCAGLNDEIGPVSRSGPGPVEKEVRPKEIPDLNNPSVDFGCGAGQKKGQTGQGTVNRRKLNSVRFRDLVSNSSRKKKIAGKIKERRDMHGDGIGNSLVAQASSEGSSSMVGGNI
ncbi:hypothetical protein LXL04_032693 [Taraxacum kok-saghyz]